MSQDAGTSGGVHRLSAAPSGRRKDSAAPEATETTEDYGGYGRLRIDTAAGFDEIDPTQHGATLRAIDECPLWRNPGEEISSIATARLRK